MFSRIIQYRRKYLPILISIVFIFSCHDSPTDSVKNDPSNSESIIILYTNDEHGWMEPEGDFGGSAGIVGLWKGQEGYSEDKDNYLILSGGDMWTGPAISTWFKGESMADVMNEMNYSAAAIGNHEFDFAIDGLKERMEQSNFPFLSANIREKSSGNIPDFIDPYIIKKVAGLKVGIIGLTTTSSPFTTFPDNVKDYDFIDYDDALSEIAPKVKAEGAEIIITIGHICSNEMQSLVSTAITLGISVITGGHCNQLVAQIANDKVALLQGGDRLEYYGKLEIRIDPDTKAIIDLNPSFHENKGGTPDVDVQSVVQNWRTQADLALSEVIGYTNSTIDRSSFEMWNMVMDSWLYVFPQADAALSNAGGIRQSIPEGNITLSTIVGLLPFENTILQLELTGNELISCIEKDIILGGITTMGGYQFMDGSSIESSTTYSVYTIDYTYSRSDYKFRQYDPDPYTTSVQYRQPLIDWIKSLNTTVSNPLNNYLDYTPRR